MHLKSLHDNTVKRLADLTLKSLDSILELTTRCISVHVEHLSACRLTALHCCRSVDRAYMPPSPLHATDIRCRMTGPSSSPERLLWRWAGVVAMLSHLLSRMSGQRMRHLENPWSPCWAVATCDLLESLSSRHRSPFRVLSDRWALRMLFSILVSWKCVLFSSKPRCIS